MSPTELIVFKGKKSQTGLAFQNEFPGINNFIETDHNFKKIKEMMAGPLHVILPIWNSHEGEITLSYALSMIFEKNARLYYLWPKEIEFQCLFKSSDDIDTKTVISVPVAKTQCSEFITEHNLIFIDADDTTDAYNKFKNDNKENYYSVLTAPELNPDNFNVLSEQAQNNLNFTTFTILGSSHTENWKIEDWGKLSSKIFPPKRVYVGIQMPFDVNFSDNQQELFDRLIQDIESVEDMPKALFVSSYNASECRILFEANDEFAPAEILDNEGDDELIEIIHKAGMTAFNYPERAMTFLDKKLDFSQFDFVKHEGTQACFFACPALGIVTHGSEVETTKLIVLKMINKCFELLAKIDIGETLSPAEALFKKYEADYYDKGINCISFDAVG